MKKKKLIVYSFSDTTDNHPVNSIVFEILEVAYQKNWETFFFVEKSILKNSTEEKLNETHTKLFYRKRATLFKSVFFNAISFKLIEWLNFEGLKIAKLNPDYVIVNEGSPFQASQNKSIQKLVQRKVPVISITHQVSDVNSQDAEVSSEKKHFYNQITNSYFTSKVSIDSLERKMGEEINNKNLFFSPLRSKPQVLPWNESHKLQMASVARLEINDKAQDLLLQALSGEEWKKGNGN